jgi:hypothetical protein
VLESCRVRNLSARKISFLTSDLYLDRLDSELSMIGIECIVRFGSVGGRLVLRGRVNLARLLLTTEGICESRKSFTWLVLSSCASGLSLFFLSSAPRGRSPKTRICRFLWSKCRSRRFPHVYGFVHVAPRLLDSSYLNHIHVLCLGAAFPSPRAASSVGLKCFAFL